MHFSLGGMCKALGAFSNFWWFAKCYGGAIHLFLCKKFSLYILSFVKSWAVSNLAFRYA